MDTKSAVEILQTLFSVKDLWGIAIIVILSILLVMGALGAFIYFLVKENIKDRRDQHKAEMDLRTAHQLESVAIWKTSLTEIQTDMKEYRKEIVEIDRRVRDVENEIKYLKK